MCLVGSNRYRFLEVWFCVCGLLFCGWNNSGTFTIAQDVVPTRRKTSSSSSPIPTANLLIWADFVSGSKFWNSSGSSSPANNDHIRGYTDISGNNNHLTNTAASVSALGVYQTANGPAGGQPYVAFTANVSGTGLSNYLNTTLFSQPNTYYFVMEDPGNGVSATFFDSAFSGVNRNDYFFSTGSGGVYDLFAGSFGQTLGQLAGSKWTVVTFQFNGASSLTRTNGVVRDSGLNPGTAGIQGIVIGNRGDAINSSSINVAAFLMYNAGHNSTTMHQVETFLGNEYGITIH